MENFGKKLFTARKDVSISSVFVLYLWEKIIGDIFFLTMVVEKGLKGNPACFLSPQENKSLKDCSTDVTFPISSNFWSHLARLTYVLPNKRQTHRGPKNIGIFSTQGSLFFQVKWPFSSASGQKDFHQLKVRLVYCLVSFVRKKDLWFSRIR